MVIFHERENIFITTVQFVVPSRIEADSSPIHVSQFESGPYPYWPNRTVDGNFSQDIRACLHTAVSSGITEAWLRIDLLTLRSVKYVKFWYRNDSKYKSWKTQLIVHLLLIEKYST